MNGKRTNGFKTNGHKNMMKLKEEQELLKTVSENLTELGYIKTYPTTTVDNRYLPQDRRNKSVVLGTHCFCGFPLHDENSHNTEGKHKTREHLMRCPLYGAFITKEFADYMRLTPAEKPRECWKCGFSIFVKLTGNRNRCITCFSILEESPAALAEIQKNDKHRIEFNSVGGIVYCDKIIQKGNVVTYCHLPKNHKNECSGK
jgi:hypothetical protein